MVEQSEIEKINNSFMKLKELEKDLNENPDNIVNYFKEFPALFTTIYLNIKNKDIGFRDMHYNIEISSTLNFMNDYTDTLLRYFYSKKETDYMFKNNILFERLEKMYDVINDIEKELRIMNKKYYLLMEFRRKNGNGKDAIEIQPSSHFKSYFLLPTYNGLYGKELEKISQQYLMKKNLKKEYDI